VPPKSDCYEIRFRLAGYEALFPVFGLLFLAGGILPPGESLAPRVFFIACGGLFILPFVILLASRPIVFRADHACITLGPELPTLQLSSSFIPSADIDTVSLYKRVGLSNQRGKSPGTYIEVVLDDMEPAAPWATRRINTWRLDRQRLAAVTATSAPGVRIVDATADRKLWRRP
jgi:hypothetical protein